ncbi:MAG: hypothetical protein JW928_02320 [Candidatus Aureabacteria bacterium]|nr:hypothetical protein [Candidatus Auribacterota bacterium]
MKTQYVPDRDNYVITPESTLKEAKMTMQNMEAGLLPVFHEGQFFAFLNHRDIAVYLSLENKNPQKITVETFLRQHCNNAFLS